jgi:peptide/nickel transport system ATP-binding protein
MVKVDSLKKYYHKSSLFGKVRTVRALDGVSFWIKRGESLGVVGESGCGKSTLALSLMGLNNPVEGKIEIDGTDIASLTKEELRLFRKNMSIVLQDSLGSLNPKMRCGDIVSEPARIFHDISKPEITDKTVTAFEQVGLSAEYLRRFPHELSGGQRQRINIARAIILKPKFTIFDEPVSSLDVSVQAQILNLLSDLRENSDMTSIMISHNLSVIRFLCDSVAVFYLGKIVEYAPVNNIFERALHPYTQSLLDSSFDTSKINGSFAAIEGDIPSPENPPSGCAFHPRCPRKMNICSEIAPCEKTIDGAKVFCHLYQ